MLISLSILGAAAAEVVDLPAITSHGRCSWHNFLKNIKEFHSALNFLTMKKTIPNKKNKRTGQKPLPPERTEKDADDLAHSQQEELPKEAGEEDLDDLVHEHHKPKPDSLNESKPEEDPDDLAHRYYEEEDEDNK
jgi:hypothetical protein